MNETDHTGASLLQKSESYSAVKKVFTMYKEFYDSLPANTINNTC
jgi:hypothetical protein